MKRMFHLFTAVAMVLSFAACGKQETVENLIILAGATAFAVGTGHLSNKLLMLSGGLCAMSGGIGGHLSPSWRFGKMHEGK